MTRKQSAAILKSLRAFYGPVVPALEYRNPYELTIAVVLSAQTTDAQVNRVTPQLFSRFPDFASLAQAELGEVMRIIHSTGFFRTKAEHIIALARMVADDYHGVLPHEKELLVRLPGVGTKSANVIRAQGFGIPAMAVDTHVSRVAWRLGYTDVRDVVKAERELCAMIPEDEWSEAHLILIVHGRRTCTARNPRCAECPVSRLCPYTDSAP